jgi:oxygen-independent coproporphyrinogen-3 oxidase
MLELRLASGYPVADVAPAGRTAVAAALGGGLLQPEPFKAGLMVLTLRGRLLADALVRDLLG